MKNEIEANDSDKQVTSFHREERLVRLLPSRRFTCAACGDKCRSSIADRGKRTMCRPCESGRRHHTVDGGKPYNAAWAWVNLGACTINGVSYAKNRRTGITYRNDIPMPNAGGMARELAAQDSDNTTDLNG